VREKIYISSKINIISLLILISFLSFDIFNFLKLGNQKKIINENKKAIVVLTGGPRRLEEGFQLLERKLGSALFISGVKPIVTKKDLKKILNTNNSNKKNILFDCCVYYEKKSKNTQSNSIEANKWLTENDYNEIFLVTSTSHMPRSIYEFKKNAPKIIIYPWNIAEKEKTTFNNLKKITIEYLKFNFIRLQYLFRSNNSYEH
jgi:uncharacterized SAM-binding protein YcdF (DUF218 family)